MSVPLRPFDLVRLRVEHPDLKVIDVRTPGEFAASHIPGSYNVPLPELGEHRAEIRAASAPVVLVCQSGRRAAQAETQLAEAGLLDVHVLEGGLQAWQAAEQPTAHDDAGPLPWTLERQVRLVAGGLVAASIAISVVWPQGRYLAGAVGVGLAGAALTDSCILGNLLARMPYNRRSADAGCDMPTVVAELTGLTERSGTPS
jgi:rhodanese-related sulfurtransferase